MPWQYSDEYYREYTRTTWNESAEAYGRLLGRLEPFRGDLVRRLDPRPGESILDLGTGPGEPAMTIARVVGPRGRVTGVDLSEKMIGICREVAAARELRNVRFEPMDSSALTLPDASFDAAVCSFGFQIFTDPETAAREAHRVVRPGGRIAVSVWGTADRVPFLHALIGPMLKHAEPDEAGYIPTPYETGGPGEMVAFLETAGFRSGTEERVKHVMRFASPDDYLDSMLQGTPIGHSLSEEDPEVQAEVLKETRANLSAALTPTGIELPAEALIVSATR